MVMKLGMLDVAKMSVVEQQAMFNQVHEEEVRRAEGKALAVLAGKVEPVN
jgi:DNA topoisomerase VI subunit A